MNKFYSLFIFKTRKLPIIEPAIKLEPTIKLIGSSIVSSINKFTLLLFELFCIPINKSKNKQELKIADKNNFLIEDVIEKPSIKEAPSNKAVIGRYILPRKIFAKLLSQKPGKGGEIHITDAIQSLINENEKFIAHNFAGKYLDCGTMSGFIKSNIEIGKL